jgi:hypothetical protein
MAEARQFDDWNHTAFVVATLANVNRSEDTPAYEARQFHPFLADKKADAKKEPPPPPGPITALKVFLPCVPKQS